MKQRIWPLLAALSLLAAACASDATVTANAAVPLDNGTDIETISETVSQLPESVAITDDVADDEAVNDALASNTDVVENDDSNVVDQDESTNDDVDESDIIQPEGPDQQTCSAPTLQGHFVDVAIDDPDGGLNLRDVAGPSNAVITTIERGGELIPTGECEVVGSTDWWQVTNTDGSLIGWVSSSFLSESPIASPGLGRAEVDNDNVGLTAVTLEGLAAQLAIAYGFDQDVVITQVGDAVGNDASSGTVVFDLEGLRDDSSNGYRVDILFFINRDEANDGQAAGFTTTSISRQALCSRGVTDDGLCI